MFTLWASTCAFDTLVAASLKKEIVPFESPITTSLLGENTAHKTYFGFDTFYKIKREQQDLFLVSFERYRLLDCYKQPRLR